MPDVTGQPGPSTNQGSQSNMNQDTETIPWLIYRGIRLEEKEEEGGDEPGQEERRENEQWWEAETGGDYYEEADNQASRRLRHITRVHVEESVTAIGAMAFMHCTELREIRIAETVTSIGNNAFAFCESLVTIQFPGPLRAIEWNAFTLCSLASIWLPDSVVSIGALAFSRCVFLQSVRLPGRITRIQLGAFTGCLALSSLEIPASVISIERLAFSSCQSLRAVTMSVSSNLSNIGRAAFGQCPMLTEIKVGKIAVALWPWLLRQLGSNTGLFGHNTGVDNRQRSSFVLSFLWKHMMQFFKGGNTVQGWPRKMLILAEQKQIWE